MSRRPPLSRRLILQAALELVDREGIEALTMRRLGTKLGVEAMSLYNHVAGKEAVLDGIAELLLDEVVVPPPDAERWEQAWSDVGRSYRRMGHRHPRAFPLVALRWSRTEGVLRRTVQALRILLAAGMSTPLAMQAFVASESFTRGFVLEELGRAAQQTAPEAERQAPGVEDGDDELVAALLRYRRERDRDAEYEFGLRVVMIGLRQSLADQA